MIRSYRPSLRIWVVPLQPTSSAPHSKTVRAADDGVPRFHSFTIRGYPDDVSEPGPKSVPSHRVSASRHATNDLASGRLKPPETNSLVFVSNSRRTDASEPPGERFTRHRSYSGARQVAPWKTQGFPSALASASTSRTVSHCGAALR